MKIKDFRGFSHTGDRILYFVNKYISKYIYSFLYSTIDRVYYDETDQYDARTDDQGKNEIEERQSSNYT